MIKGTRRNYTEETIGDLKILFASNSKMTGVKTAMVNFNSKLKRKAVKVPVAYNNATDVLSISVADSKGNHFSMYDIDTISITA